MLQAKDTDWLNGYNKTCIYAVYKKATSDLKTYIQTESERMEKYIPWKRKAKEN